MKLRNKKTGDVFDFDSITDLCFGSKIQFQATNMHNKPIYIFNSLAELNEEWEDYKEPKEYWYIEPNGVIARIDEWDCCTDSDIEIMKSLGNYFETREQAEKVVEKLKAWKRLKDKGFRFERWLIGGEYGNTITFSDYIECNDETRADLDLLFGGEDESNQ